MNDRALIAGALLLGYLYMKNNAQLAAAGVAAPGRAAMVPQSLPSSTGSGLQQIATGALDGFLRSLAGGPSNNTATTVIPTNVDWIDRSGMVQEAVSDIPDAFNDLVGGDDFLMGWA